MLCYANYSKFFSVILCVASKGARDAADWAIDRSLSALRHIDESGISSSDSRKKFGTASSTHSLDSSNCDISV